MANLRSNHIDCGIVIALREEYSGQEPFGGFNTVFQVDEVQDSVSFITFSFYDSNGDRRRGVVAVMQGMTPMLAYETTRNLIERYNPEIMVNVGLAGALAGHLRLGDVVIATFADNYDSGGKAVEAGSTFGLHWGGQPYSTSDDLCKTLQRIWAYRGGLHIPWQDRCDDRLRAGIQSDLVNTLRERELLGDKQQLEAGAIASGDTVGAAKAFRSLLLARNRKFLALEMESAGFLRACLAISPSYPRVAIKAISDLADEGKEQLDKSSGDSIRAWAMSNALDLLAVACRNLFEFSRTKSRNQVVQPPESMADKLLDFAVQKQFKKQHKSLADRLDKYLPQYHALFTPLVVSNPITNKPNIFAALAESVANSSSPYPLRISGKPGTGKTTFLTILFLALHRRSKEVTGAPVPCYINVKRYTMRDLESPYAEFSAASLQDDLAILRAVLDSQDDIPLIFVLDGIDEYVRYDHSVEGELLEFIKSRPAAQKIIGVGLNYLADRDKFRRTLPYLSGADMTIHIDGITVGQQDTLESFVKAFQSIQAGIVDEQSTRNVINRARSFGLQQLDLLLVSLLFDSMGVDRYSQAQTLSEFFLVCCSDVLQKYGSVETVSQAAKLAFDFTVRPEPLDVSSHIQTRAWKLLHSHPIIKDFLVAYNAVQLVRNAAKGITESLLQDLNYVYPHAVNRFCKDIANSSIELQWDVLQGAKRIFLDGGENAKPHACYLVGRLTDHDVQLQAASWLRESAMPEVLALKAKPDNKLKPGELLLARTVFISLAYLGDEDASTEYLQLLMDRPVWNNVNRGFHLEYYADIPFDPERQLSHEDRLGQFVNTYDSLRKRITTNMGNRDYGLFNIEVFTLYSLAQHRHVRKGLLANRVREDLLDLIPKLLDAGNLSAPLIDYLNMLRDNFAEAQFPVGRVAERLYGLKTEIRAGWLERRLQVDRIESVAEHTMGAYVLGLLYLPDNNPENWPGYNKAEVLQMVMIHDLAEALSGDVTFRNSTDATREKERQSFRYIMTSRTYPRVADLQNCYRQWEEFESGAHENAKIARDLDKLDNLMQLYIYSRRTEIEDFRTWKAHLTGKIITQAGKRVLDIIRENFDGDERSIGSRVADK